MTDDPVTRPLVVEVDPDEGTATVIDVSPSTFDPHEPFLMMTVARLLANDAAPRVASLGPLVNELRRVSTDAPEPIAFVVHSGRCGSTLVTHLLDAHPDVMVFREPEPLAPLLQRSIYLSGAEREEAGAALDAIVRSYATLAAMRGRRAVVKMPSPATALTPALAARFTTTPFVSVWREPEASVASFLASPAPWAARLYDGPEVQARWWPALARPQAEPLTATRFFSFCWASAIDGIVGVPPARRRLVDHHELTSSPKQMFADLMSWVGLDPAGVAEDQLDAISATYAKDPARATPFDPAGAHHRPALPARAEVEVGRITAAARQRLRLAMHPR
jgi:hypothetical protein